MRRNARFHQQVAAFKRRLLLETLAACEGNRTVAAERLGLQRTHLLRLLRDLGIQDAVAEATTGKPARDLAARLRSGASADTAMVEDSASHADA